MADDGGSSEPFRRSPEPSSSTGEGGISRISEPRPRRRSRRAFNPAGKDALFSVADQDAGRRLSGTEVADVMGAGRKALFGAKHRAIGMARIECSSCGRTARVTWLELALARLPLSLWIPFRSYDHFMRCPSCGKLSWSRVSLFG